MLAGTEEAFQTVVNFARYMSSASNPSGANPESNSAALRALLTGLIDYAGTFPPAKLSLENAAGNFIAYLRGPHSWMLGKLIVPAAQLGQLRDLLRANPAAQDLACPVSVLLGAEPQRDAELVRKAVAAHTSFPAISVDAVEFRPGSPAMIAEMAAALPKTVPAFCEIPVTEDMSAWLAAIHGAGWSAKIRTGGTTIESFPSASKVAEFIAQCYRHGVAFKATAGLHHPVRSEHALTYEPNSACGAMHGFLNVFLGAALLECGISAEQLVEILDDTQAASFRFSGQSAHWNKLFLSANDLSATRQRFAISFGSCSFEEPISDLQQLGLL